MGGFRSGQIWLKSFSEYSNNPPGCGEFITQLRNNLLLRKDSVPCCWLVVFCPLTFPFACFRWTLSSRNLLDSAMLISMTKTSAQVQQKADIILTTEVNTAINVEYLITPNTCLCVTTMQRRTKSKTPAEQCEAMCILLAIDSPCSTENQKFCGLCNSQHGICNQSLPLHAARQE